MKRRSFLSQATAGAALLPLVPPAPEIPPPLVLTPPATMAPRPDGAELVWGVSRHARGWVELQDEAGVLHPQGSTAFGYTPQSERALRVRLDGLTPGKSYTYRIVTQAMGNPAATQVGEWRRLRTLDPKAQETRFAVWNDTHLHDPTLRQLYQSTPDVDFLVWNGDICNQWDQEALLIPALLHPGGTDFTARAPLCFVWGNHDLRGAHGFRLADYVATPSNRSYYAFRSGPVAVVCLNTGEDKADDHPSFAGRVACQPLRQAQAAWLREHVLTTPELRDAPYRIAFCHIPLRWKDESLASNQDYDNYSRRSRDLWHDALVQWGTQVVISGHTHEPHWMPPSAAFPYAQWTGGGPGLEEATLLSGHADPTRLQLSLRTLDGRLSQQQELRPLS